MSFLFFGFIAPKQHSTIGKLNGTTLETMAKMKIVKLWFKMLAVDVLTLNCCWQCIWGARRRSPVRFEIICFRFKFAVWVERKANAFKNCKIIDVLVLRSTEQLFLQCAFYNFFLWSTARRLNHSTENDFFHFLFNFPEDWIVFIDAKFVT